MNIDSTACRQANNSCQLNLSMEKNIALWYMLLIAFAAGISTSTVKSTLAMVKIRQTLLERV